MPDGFGSSAAVCPTDQSTVLLAIVALLRDQVPEFSTLSTCFVSETVWPSAEVNDNTFCTVCPGHGQFDQELAIGAGKLGIFEDSGLQITVWTRLSLDQLERAEIVFSDRDRGLLALKRKVLKALYRNDGQLYGDYPANTRPLLAGLLKPISSRHEQTRRHDGDFASFSITFEAPFYWEIVS